jgi:hypothetical protein
MSGMICQFNHEFCKLLTNIILKGKKIQEHKDAIPPNFTKKYKMHDQNTFKGKP